MASANSKKVKRGEHRTDGLTKEQKKTRLDAPQSTREPPLSNLAQTKNPLPLLPDTASSTGTRY